MTPFCHGVAFRVDASLQIGSGHLVRCLTLADALAHDGVDCHLVTRAHDMVATRLLADTAHTVHWLPPSEQPQTWPDIPHARWLEVPWELDAAETREVLAANRIDWLVVDHYALDARWERAVEPQRLLVVDDLADRAHDCSLLLDANFGRRSEDYQGLLSASGPLLLGAGYALLRPEFLRRREAACERLQRSRLGQVLIALGGTDVDDQTSQVIRALCAQSQDPPWRLDVVIGGGNPNQDKVAKALEGWQGASELTVAASDLADRMLMADLAIGAAGTMAWERCCLGLPSLNLCLADNQRYALEALQAAGASQTLDTPQQAARWLAELSNDPDRLASMSQAASRMVDGWGTQRVMQAMASYLGTQPGTVQ